MKHNKKEMSANSIIRLLILGLMLIIPIFTLKYSKIIDYDTYGDVQGMPGRWALLLYSWGGFVLSQLFYLWFI